MLAIISASAESICGTLPHDGESGSLTVSTDRDIELGHLTAQLIDLGVAGAKVYQSKTYKNVLQQDLASQLQHTQDCKKDVFQLLLVKMLPTSSESGDSQERSEPAFGDLPSIFGMAREQLLRTFPTGKSPKAGSLRS